jgi:hypothetical protein
MIDTFCLVLGACCLLLGPGCFLTTFAFPIAIGSLTPDALLRLTATEDKA